MPGEQSKRADGEVQSNPDTSNRDLVEAVQLVASEIKQLRLHLQSKGNKLSGAFMSAPKAKFGSAIKPKSFK